MEFIKILLNIRSLRAVARDLTLEQLEEGLAKLSAVVDELRELKLKEQREAREREEKVRKYLDMMAADGIDISELAGGTVVTSPTKNERAPRAPRPPKYQYTDENGEQRTWTGQGRQPLPIRTAIEHEGKTLADFLIPTA